jgi:hypothetical protein
MNVPTHWTAYKELLHCWKVDEYRQWLGVTFSNCCQPSRAVFGSSVSMVAIHGVNWPHTPGCVMYTCIHEEVFAKLPIKCRLLKYRYNGTFNIERSIHILPICASSSNWQLCISSRYLSLDCETHAVLWWDPIHARWANHLLQEPCKVRQQSLAF